MKKTIHIKNISELHKFTIEKYNNYWETILPDNTDIYISCKINSFISHKMIVKGKLFINTFILNEDPDFHFEGTLDVLGDIISDGNISSKCAIKGKNIRCDGHIESKNNRIEAESIISTNLRIGSGKKYRQELKKFEIEWDL